MLITIQLSSRLISPANPRVILSSSDELSSNDRVVAMFFADGAREVVGAAVSSGWE
jgi:hypothetical protein